MEVIRLESNDLKWNELIEYAENCSWIAGKPLASMMRNHTFDEWESVFAAITEDKIIGFCTFLKTDYYPENRYSPWISTIFVDEKYGFQKIDELQNYGGDIDNIFAKEI